MRPRLLLALAVLFPALAGQTSVQTTWAPLVEHGAPTPRSALPEAVFAFPRQRKEPLTDAAHVRSAIARFHQVKGVSDGDRDLAIANIEKAARYYGVDLSTTSWRDLGPRPQPQR